MSITGLESDPANGMVFNQAGDINGDGFDDVVLGSPKNLQTLLSCEYGQYIRHHGSNYILFGGEQTAGSIDVNSITNNEGIVINGNFRQDKLGMSTSGVGDINGDGFQDFSVSREGEYHYYYNYCLKTNHSETYIIFGDEATDLSEINLFHLDGTNGFVVIDSNQSYNDFTNVSAAGDMNSDGVDDLSLCYFNYCLIIFGHITPFQPKLYVNQLKDPAIAIKIQSSFNSERRTTIQPLKDFNGDGIDDYLYWSKNLAVVYGKTEEFPLVNNVSQMPLNEVYHIESATQPISNFSGIGDFNNDGLNDFILGQPEAFDERGTSYVIYGITDLVYKSNFEQ